MHLTNTRSSPEWFGENTDCGSREEINKLTLRFLGWASSHQQTWTIEWKQTLNNRWSQQRRYVTGRLQWYPQDTAESFVKWSSAGLLHSPALFKKEEEGRKKKEVLHLSRCYTHTHTPHVSPSPFSIPAGFRFLPLVSSFVVVYLVHFGFKVNMIIT